MRKGVSSERFSNIHRYVTGSALGEIQNETQTDVTTFFALFFVVI
jgi:hypothetical protein